MARSRHAKGTKQGGQWVSSPSALDVVVNPITIAAAPNIDKTQINRDELTIKLGGKQRTFRQDDTGRWLLPLRLSSTIARALISNNDDFHPDENEAFDIASVVITDMIADGYKDIPAEMINNTAKSAVRGAYGFMLWDDSWGKPSYLSKVNKWQIPSDPSENFVQLEATIRGIRAAAKVGTYNHTQMDTQKGSSNNENFLRQTLGLLGCLHPMWDPPRIYLGDNPCAVQRLMETKIGWPHNEHTLMRFILEDTKPREKGLDHSYAALCFYLLSKTSPNESLHQQALDKLDSWAAERGTERYFLHCTFKDKMDILRGTSYLHKLNPRIDKQAYERAIYAIIAADGRPCSQMMKAVR